MVCMPFLDGLVMLKYVVALRSGKLAVFELILPDPSFVVPVWVRVNWPFESNRTADTAVSTARKGLDKFEQQ